MSCQNLSAVPVGTAVALDETTVRISSVSGCDKADVL